MNENLREAFEKANAFNKDINQFHSSTILITGATGFIGHLLAQYFLFLNQVEKTNIHILLYVRDLEKAKRMYKEEELANLEMIEGKIEVIKPSEFKHHQIDYIVHCASNTRSADMIKNPVEVLDCIVAGTKELLELARLKQVKSMVYLSSMEVYGNISEVSLVTEDLSGQVDIFSTRSCYPLGKRVAENYCYNYFKEYKVPVKVARLAQTFGVGILKEENRIFLQIANSVREHQNITLHTEGRSMGNYCDSFDMISAILLLLLQGEDGEAYNIVNEENTMQIRQMAELVANKVAGKRIEVIYDIADNDAFGYAPNTGLRLSSGKLRALGWRPKKNIVNMYCDMIEWMDKEKF